MLIPPGTGKHKELNTSYTKFDQLLQDLSANRFSGYVKTIFWGFEGLVVFDTGRMIQAFSAETVTYLTGEAAIMRVLDKAKEPEGAIEVYQLSDEIAISLGYAITAVPYNNSSYRNHNVGHVFDFLGQNQMSGFVDIQFSEKKGIGTVYFMEGVPVEAIVMTSKGKLVNGAQIVHKILELENFIHSIEVFQVNQPDPILKESAFIMPLDSQKYFDFWKECLHYLSDLMENKFRKKNFYEAISLNRKELKDEFPFLAPNSGQIDMSKEEFAINNFLHRNSFQEGMAALLRRTFQCVPSRRLRKIDFMKVIKDLNKIAMRNDLSTDQINPETFIFNIFDGLV